MRDDPQTRFASSCTDAMFGYANAACSAYWTAVENNLKVWSDTTDALTRTEEKPRSWFRAEPTYSNAMWGVAPTGQPSTPSFNPFDPFNLLAPPAPGMQSPFAVGMAMFPLRGPPLAWPMAAAMLAYGVPRSVAWPTAEANAAVLDAAGVINEQTEAAFTSYQTGGGHAIVRMAPNTSLNAMLSWMLLAGASLWQMPLGRTFPLT